MCNLEGTETTYFTTFLRFYEIRSDQSKSANEHCLSKENLIANIWKSKWPPHMMLSMHNSSISKIKKARIYRPEIRGEKKDNEIFWNPEMVFILNFHTFKLPQKQFK